MSSSRLRLLLQARQGLRALRSAVGAGGEACACCASRLSTSPSAARRGLLGARGEAAGVGWRGFASGGGERGGGSSSSEEGSSSEGSSSSSSSWDASSSEGSEDGESGLPQGALDDPLAYAYRLSKLPGNTYGLPPLEEIMAFDPDAEARAFRREKERAKQEQIAAARVRVVDEQGRAYATGKRKEAIARVWIQPGDGTVLVNGRALDLYFPDLTWRAHVLFPFLVTQTLGSFDAAVTVQGGGPSGQAQAVRHGVAKALQAWAPALRGALRGVGLLTRDPRVVERKKPGKPKARKSFQWVKR